MYTKNNVYQLYQMLFTSIIYIFTLDSIFSISKTWHASLTIIINPYYYYKIRVITTTNYKYTKRKTYTKINKLSILDFIERNIDKTTESR